MGRSSRTGELSIAMFDHRDIIHNTQLHSSFQIRQTTFLLPPKKQKMQDPDSGNPFFARVCGRYD